MKNKIKVLLVDDNPVIRTGIAKILENEKDVEIVGEAVDGIEAVDKALELKPDLVIMEIYMRLSNRMQAILAIRKELPEVRVLIFSCPSACNSPNR